VALIATGIGAILVALGAMVVYLQTTREGITRLNKVLIPLKTVFGGLVGVIQDFGEALLNAFKNPREAIENLKRSLAPLRNIIEGILTLDRQKINEGYQEIRGQV